MEIEKFNPGAWQKGYEYKFFLPAKIDHTFTFSDSAIQKKLEKAYLKLGELNSYAKLVPDINTFIRSYIRKEAVTSSRIEGTKTNIEEAFTDKVNIDPEYRDDWVEVNQYVLAMDFALKQLSKIPLSNRLLKVAHKVLLSHGRGKNKQPGEFRRSQNWIGGLTPKDAVFVPPSAEHVDDLMSDLEKFLHNEEIQVPYLIKIAIAHYQFETIHPFLDGNGRVGRLLIVLYFISQGVLEKPLLYISDFFEKNKGLYYDKLSLVREKKDLLGWIKFFLDGVTATAEAAASTLQRIIDLKEELHTSLVENFGKRAKSGQALLKYLFFRPVVTMQQVKGELGVANKTTYELVDMFVKYGILKEITGYKRNRLFAFEKYLNLLKK